MLRVLTGACFRVSYGVRHWKNDGSFNVYTGMRWVASFDEVPFTRRHGTNRHVQSAESSLRCSNGMDVCHKKPELGDPNNNTFAATGSSVFKWWVLLDKAPVSQQFKDSPIFYGTPNFITVFTRVLHVSLYWDRLIESMSPHSVFSEMPFYVILLPASSSF